MVDTLFQIDRTAVEADQKTVRHTIRNIKTMWNKTEVQSIDTVVLVLLLAYAAVEMGESDRNIFSVFFKMVTSIPTWYDIVYLINQTGIDFCKALSFFYCLTPIPFLMGKGNVHFFMHR